ncbi:unnamed protein product [Rotaria magnacalcarata]|uniref:Peptidase A2 domain-containing protein n=1 Tax=Rotaria magnacalcarata TaxID=392030 RepID=A0A819XB06_9BILA|nr:unnamed protein product [Rotaria magnacalcarata]
MVDGHIYKGLIDSGAQVSLIALATVVNNHNFANVKHSELEIKRIGGGVKVLGEITLNMQVAKEVQMEQLFIVVESLGTDLLLGANFLIKNRIVLDLANKKVLQEEKNKVNLNKSINLNSDYYEIKLINTVNLKPQSSTVVAYTLNCNLNNNKLVTNYGIFPDENKLYKDLLIASFIIDSKCEKFVVPIMNCSEKMIQVKANTVIGFAQKLNISDKGILSEVGHEWVPKEVNIVSNENESLADKFRMKETDLSETELTRVTELLNKFNTIVSKNDEDVGFTNTIQHRIELTKDTAIKQPIRRVTGELANEIEEILLKDEAAGIIRRSHSAWSSCIVPVKKKCGGKKVLEWSEECEKSFLSLKEMLTHPRLLAYPDYKSEEPLELHVDASLTGAGAVLSQRQLGITKPIAFISTTFGATEASYSSTARELAGLSTPKNISPFEHQEDINKTEQLIDETHEQLNLEPSVALNESPSLGEQLEQVPIAIPKREGLRKLPPKAEGFYKL